jgi:histidine triad (HIT) family protein
MATVFSRIIAGELPGRFVHQDEHAVSMLTIAPIREGHVLVVPRLEVDHWIDLSPALAAHLMTNAQIIGKALKRAFSPPRIGMMIAGMEVPHVHLHVLPVSTTADMDFANAHQAAASALDAAAEKIRAALRALGVSGVP